MICIAIVKPDVNHVVAVNSDLPLVRGISAVLVMVLAYGESQLSLASPFTLRRNRFLTPAAQRATSHSSASTARCAGRQTSPRPWSS